MELERHRYIYGWLGSHPHGCHFTPTSEGFRSLTHTFRGCSRQSPPMATSAGPPPCSNGHFYKYTKVDTEKKATTGGIGTLLPYSLCVAFVSVRNSASYEQQAKEE